MMKYRTWKPLFFDADAISCVLWFPSQSTSDISSTINFDRRQRSHFLCVTLSPPQSGNISNQDLVVGFQAVNRDQTQLIELFRSVTRISHVIRAGNVAGISHVTGNRHVMSGRCVLRSPLRAMINGLNLGQIQIQILRVLNRRSSGIAGIVFCWLIHIAIYVLRASPVPLSITLWLSVSMSQCVNGSFKMALYHHMFASESSSYTLYRALYAFSIIVVCTFYHLHIQ